MTILRTMRNFSSMNIAASILLFVAAIAAAIIANSPVAPVYQEFLLHELHLQIGDFNLLSHGGENLRMIEFINDGLMTTLPSCCTTLHHSALDWALHLSSGTLVCTSISCSPPRSGKVIGA